MTEIVVLFQVRYENTHWGDTVYLFPNYTDTSTFDAASVIPMNCKDGCWYAFVALQTGVTFNYKVFLILLFNVIFSLLVFVSK